MRLGIIGLPNSGKTTIFNALTHGNRPTGAATSGQFEVFNSVVDVPDLRVTKLSAMFNPRKTIYTQVTYSDIAGLEKGVADGGLKGQFRNELAQVDGYVHVVREFQNDAVPHPEESINPQRDVDTLETEFFLTDLVTVENRIAKLQDELKKKGKTADKNVAGELEVFERLKAHLDTEKPLRDMGLTEAEIKPLRGYGLLTLKPVLIVLNTGEEAKDPAQYIQYDHHHSKITSLQGRLEAEISQLDGDDAQMFMDEYNITELSASKLIRLSYELMAIQSFFTVGEDEVRAWPVPIGSTAPEAAGVIHSDLQKGFIRAEVTAYEDLIAAGSLAGVKSAGKFRLEGKEYIVKDGDILNIRFNI